MADQIKTNVNKQCSDKAIKGIKRPKPGKHPGKWHGKLNLDIKVEILDSSINYLTDIKIVVLLIQKGYKCTLKEHQKALLILDVRRH